MKRTEENQYSMMRTVQSLFRDHQDVLDAVPALESASNKLDNLLTELSIAIQVQQDGAQGETETKNRLKQTLVDTGLGIMGAVKALANDTNDGPLFDRVDYTPSGFGRLRDNALAEAAQSIHDAAFENKQQLEDYGILADDITVFENAITAYRGVISGPRVAVSEQKAQTERISQLVAQANDLLKNTMDNIMLQYKLEDPVFFNTYMSARAIVDTGIRHTAIRGKVTDAATGLPLYSAKVTIIELDRTASTGTDGVYGITEFEGGVYSVKVEMDGYVSQTKPVVELQRGRGMELNFQLTKV